MDDFIAKPIAPEPFLATVARIIASGDGWGERRDRRPARAAPPADLDESQLDALGRLLPPDRLRSVVESYLGVAEERLRRIEGMAQSLDLKGVAREAHDLKGVSGSVGARRLEALAKRLEHACKTEDAPAALALIVEIRSASMVAWALVSRRLSRVADVAA